MLLPNNLISAFHLSDMQESYALMGEKMKEQYELQKLEPGLRCELYQVKFHIMHHSLRSRDVSSEFFFSIFVSIVARSSHEKNSRYESICGECSRRSRRKGNTGESRFKGGTIAIDLLGLVRMQLIILITSFSLLWK